MTPKQLYRQRPRSRFLRASGGFALLAVVLAWTLGDLSLRALWTERSATNLHRFATDVWPRASTWDAIAAHGLSAVSTTLAIAILATALACLVAVLWIPLVSRTLARSDPFVRDDIGVLWRIVSGLARGGLIGMRAIPEYVLAFLFLTVFGASAWPAVLALALHNAGILGKLFGEVIEDADPRVSAALRTSGASRLQILGASLLPQTLNRLLLYVFVRWETAVREATVLGLLGIVSLGYFVQQSRAALRYDEMLVFVLLGSAIVLCGDGLSVAVRRWVRDA